MDTANKDAKTIKDIIEKAENQIKSGNIRSGLFSLAEICSKQPDSPEALGINIRLSVYLNVINIIINSNKIQSSNL